MKRSIFHYFNRGILQIILILGALITITPFAWMVLTSLKTYEETNAAKLVLFPANPQLSAYLAVLKDQAFLQSYLNSVFVAFLAVIGTLVSVAAVAYAFSRIDWPGRNVVFILMLSTMMIPFQSLIVPQYVLFNKIDWIGTYNPLTIPGFFAGGAAMIFLLRQFMLQIPKELDEAAVMDGASHFQIWWNIILPLSKPALATVGAFLFVGQWNSLLQPVIYLQSSKLYTLPVFLSTMVNPQVNNQPWPSIMAASVLTTLPLIVLFFFAQRYFLESIVLSGSKG